MSPSDRRRDTRFALCRPVKLQHHDGGRYYGGRTHDCSAGGALLELDRPTALAVGQPVRLGIAWDQPQALLQRDAMIDAVVVRREPAPARTCRLAVKFRQRQAVPAAATRAGA